MFSGLLLLSILPATSYAAVTPGAKCTKAGIQQTYNGKVYTCIKLGTKLYWNNGKLVKKVSPTGSTPLPLSGTVSQQNASKLATSYLKYSAYSRDGLVKQLEFEGFSNSDAVFGVDSQRANWGEQANKMAGSYLKNSAYSRSGLIDQLEFEGFTNADATYGVDAQKADWNEQAAKMAKSYLKNSAYSRSGLIDQLEFEGFSTAQAEYGVSKTGL